MFVSGLPALAQGQFVVREAICGTYLVITVDRNGIVADGLLAYLKLLWFSHDMEGMPVSI
jgi:hypothetical protein